MASTSPRFQPKSVEVNRMAHAFLVKAVNTVDVFNETPPQMLCLLDRHTMHVLAVL